MAARAGEETGREESGRGDAVREMKRSDAASVTWKWMFTGSLFLLLFVFLLGGGLRLGYSARGPVESHELHDTHDTHVSRERFPITVNRPAGSPRVATGEVDTLGRQVTVSCVSCHANLPVQPEVRAGEELTEFHQGLKFDHGKLTCLSCHHQEDYNHLRLADGRMVDYPDVQTLCTQCHASQARDYEHGAHGGMLGYWDLTRGPRQRKGCLDCHDPHVPAFPRMFPEFKPRDRFLDDRHMEAAHD
jgi:hypothetical protein